MSDDKRDRERVPILGELHGEVMVFQPMAILDISRGGAQIETPFPLQLDSLHDFRLTLGERSVVVKGRIAHCHIGDLEEELVLYRSGIEFVEPSQHAGSAIAEFVEALKNSREWPGGRRPAPVEADAPAAESLDTIDAQASGETAGDSKGRGPKAEGRKSKKK
jgi:hypothetical protein